MSLLEKRKDNARLIAEGRFLRKVLTEESESILKAQRKVMAERGFSNPDIIGNRSFTVTDDTSKFDFLKVHRFIDMKSRKTKSGVKKKKSHPIYNRIVFGHIPNIVRQLSYGFTDAIIEDMKKLED